MSEVQENIAPEQQADQSEAVIPSSSIASSSPVGLQIEEVAAQENVVLPQAPTSTDDISVVPASSMPEDGGASIRQGGETDQDVGSVGASVPEATTPAAVSIPPTVAVSAIRSLYVKARSKLLARTEKRLQKILELAASKKSITNDDVEKHLRVSHATAHRYLVNLVKSGKLARDGSPEKAKYRLIK